MIDSKNLIVLKAQNQLLSFRITYYHEMITIETTLLHNLLKTQQIIYNLFSEELSVLQNGIPCLSKGFNI